MALPCDLAEPAPLVRLQLRISTKWPAIAAAAAICGLTRWVRPPGPCRPSKLRFEVEAQRSPGSRMSGFMPRHIEQPASRHSKPASMKILSRPSCSACAFTRPEPGTTIAFTVGETFVPRTTAAAARRSSMREFVQEPRKMRSRCDVLDRGARLEVHVGRASAQPSSRAPRVVEAVRVGHAAGDVDALRRRRAPRHARLDVCRAQRHDLVELGAVVGRQRAPVVERASPSPCPSARRDGPRRRRTSCRPARPCPRARRPRSTCCRRSCGLPSRGRGSRRRGTRSRGRCRRRRRSCG